MQCDAHLFLCLSFDTKISFALCEIYRNEMRISSLNKKNKKKKHDTEQGNKKIKKKRHAETVETVKWKIRYILTHTDIHMTYNGNQIHWARGNGNAKLSLFPHGLSWNLLYFSLGWWWWCCFFFLFILSYLVWYIMRKSHIMHPIMTEFHALDMSTTCKVNKKKNKIFTETTHI